MNIIAANLRKGQRIIFTDSPMSAKIKSVTRIAQTQFHVCFTDGTDWYPSALTEVTVK